MTDQQIFDSLLQAIQTWTPGDRDAGENWLYRAAASVRLLQELETKGLTAFFDDEPA